MNSDSGAESAGRDSTLDEIIALLRQTALQKRIEGMSGSGPGALENFADELEKLKSAAGTSRAG